VIPLFISQIQEKKPITITDPNMTRFMMSLDDAVDLVLYAYKNGHQGVRFVQKAPAATIDTLARALVELFSAKTQIRTIGTRMVKNCMKPCSRARRKRSPRTAANTIAYRSIPGI